MRSLIQNSPLGVFGRAALIMMVVGVGCTVRFVWSYHTDPGQHLPALLAAVLAAVLAAGLLITGLLADGISANRRLLEDALYYLKTIDHEWAASSAQRPEPPVETTVAEVASRPDHYDPLDDPHRRRAGTPRRPPRAQ